MVQEGELTIDCWVEIHNHDLTLTTSLQPRTTDRASNGNVSSENSNIYIEHVPTLVSDSSAEKT